MGLVVTERMSEDEARERPLFGKGDQEHGPSARPLKRLRTESPATGYDSTPGALRAEVAQLRAENSALRAENASLQQQGKHASTSVSTMSVLSDDLISGVIERVRQEMVLECAALSMRIDGLCEVSCTLTGRVDVDALERGIEFPLRVSSVEDKKEMVEW